MSLKTIYLIFFLDVVELSLIMPLISPHVLSLGGSLTLAGFLTSLGSGIELVTSPLIGSWSDTRGRKLLLTCTVSLVLVSNLLLGFQSLLIFFIARILYSIAHHTDPLVKALIADNVPQSEQTASYNTLMRVACLAFIGGPILGGYLYEISHDFKVVSGFLCLVDVALLITVFSYLEEKPKKQNQKKDKKSKESKQKETFLQTICAELTEVFASLKRVDWNKYGDILKSKFFLEGSFNFFFMNMGHILREVYGYNRTHLGMAIAYLSFCMILATFLSQFAVKKFYKNDNEGSRRFLHCFALMIGLFITVPFTITSSSSSLLYLSIFLPATAGKSLLDTTFVEVLARRTTESDKGVMMGASTSMRSLSGLACPLLSGFIADYISIYALTVLPIIPAVFGLLLGLKLQQQRSIDTQKNK